MPTFYIHRNIYRDTYAGGQEGELLPLPSSMGAEGARISLYTILLYLFYLLKDIFWCLGQLGSSKLSWGQAPRPPNSLDITRGPIYYP